MPYSWTDIPDGDIDPDSPLTTPLMTGYRDNDYALAEGAIGAPRIARIARTDPGRLIQIGSPSVLSASASAIFTDLDGTYDAYLFMVRGLYLSAGASLFMTTSTDNGSTWDSANYDYHAQNMSSSAASYSATNSGSSSNIVLTSQLRTISTQIMDGDYIISGLGRTAFTSVKGSYVTQGGLGGAMFGGRQVSEVVDAIRFTGSGNLTGTITLYGIDSGA